MNVDMVL